MRLTPEGRVYEHAKNQALSGRLLNPLIYAEILSALGVELTVLANLASPDPAIAAQAGAAVFNTLSQEPDAAFDATTPIPGLRPGIPGASGYAAVYVAAPSPLPIILLAGFDLNETHLIEEDIDYGDPTVTARDVVDRETLKAFVTQAGEWFISFLEAGDFSGAWKARSAARDPNGPWIHGSVYIYILETFHQPHPVFTARFQTDSSCDLWWRLSGTWLPESSFCLRSSKRQKNNPEEGGFVEYYFDDPTDDTDSADIPKVGYARLFRAEIPAADGNVFTLDYIVESGFYGRAPDVVLN